MPDRRLDSTWLDEWRQEVSRSVTRLMESFEETHGYPAGNNTVVPADEGTHAAVPVLGDRWPRPLLYLYSVIDSVSLPDIGNGYFIHSPSTVTEHLAEYGHTALTSGVPGIVFGSVGGGNLFALADDGRVHKSRTASSTDGFDVAATDLGDFLEQLRHVVEQFAATGQPGSL
ncbi:hypothetical protein [Streptomyces sp. NPDC059909]|uniref:hypothetical protein n=1 Tax=Streptomyces sp. NPDC059909 TaxID=3346998 RepID=UPI00364FDE9F